MMDSPENRFHPIILKFGIVERRLTDVLVCLRLCLEWYILGRKAQLCTHQNVGQPTLNIQIILIINDAINVLQSYAHAPLRFR